MKGLAPGSRLHVFDCENQTTCIHLGSPKWKKKKRKFEKPIDLVYKSVELTLNFVKLLIKYDSTLIDHLDDKRFKVMTDFDFKPIK